MKTKKPQVDGTESISENGEGKRRWMFLDSYIRSMQRFKALNIFVL